MPLDTSIPMQVRIPKLPLPESPVNQLAKVLQLDGYMQQNALTRMKIGEHQRDAKEQNGLMSVLGAPGFSWENEDNRRSAFAAAPTRGPAAYKSYIDTQKDVAEVEKRRFETAKEGYGLWRRSAGAHFNDPALSREGVVQDTQAMIDAGLMNRTVGQNLINTLPEDPQQLRARLRQLIVAELPAKDMLTIFAPQPEKVDNGQQITFRDTNPNSPTYGQATAGGVVQKVADPNAVLTDQRTRQENALNRDVTVRGQNLTDQRARDFNTVTQQGNQIKGGTELRKEFEDRQEVKNFRQAMPVLASAKNAPNTPQGDLQLIYAVGKVLDPTSVVREGEMNLVVKSGTPEQMLQGYLSYLSGGGRIPPKARQNLIRALEARTAEYQRDFNQVRSSYEELARKRGIAPEDVFMNDRQQAPGGAPTVSNW